MYSGFGNPKRLNLIVANSLSELAAAGVASQRAALQNLGLADVNGALTFNAWGTNQNIVSTPSGSGVHRFRVAETSRGAGFYGYWEMAGNGFYGSLRYWDAVGNGRIQLDGLQTDGWAAFNWAPLKFGDRTWFQNAFNGFGTSTDSGNGIIQLASHTTAAGGIGFGTDVALYRAAANVLAVAAGDTLQLGVAYAAGAPAATGTLTFRDSAGTAYRVLCAV